MLRLRHKLGQKYFHFETKTWRQKQVFKSFGKVQTNITDRMKLFEIILFMGVSL